FSRLSPARIGPGLSPERLHAGSALSSRVRQSRRAASLLGRAVDHRGVGQRAHPRGERGWRDGRGGANPKNHREYRAITAFFYSITSSAWASTLAGISRPSALAVL